MSKRGENIYKRKDGRWEGRYRVILPGGQSKYVSVYAKSYAGVKEKLWVCRQRAAQRQSELPECRLTVAEILLGWLEERRDNIKTSSYIRYSNLVHQHLLPVLGSLSLRELTAPRLAAFLKQKRQRGRLDKKGGLAAKTVADLLAVIKSAVKMAAANYSLTNITALLAVKAPSFKQKQVATFSDWELAAITQGILQELTPANMAVLLCLNTGLRLGEVCALGWQDIDFVGQTLTVRQNVQRLTQNGKSGLLLQTPKSATSLRIIPLTAEILLLLKSLPQQPKGDFVFGGGKPLEPRTLQYRFAALLKSCGIEPRNFHTLRHTFATRYIAAGADVKSLSEILGHANVRITMQLYLHPSLERKRSFMENISTLNGKESCA